ncbi:hypothetical protein GOL81_31865 [Sinorhizobium medicae]|nr:hypothetical protein [Sinorhizobium medicae]MQX95134.1 hypothetical protein [Sinorhizobium medicae]
MRAGQRSADGVLYCPKRFLLANPILADQAALGIGHGRKFRRQGDKSLVDVFVFAALQLHVGPAQPLNRHVAKGDAIEFGNLPSALACASVNGGALIVASTWPWRSFVVTVRIGSLSSWPSPVP